MIRYTTGDLLKASTEALVNTVNCEGYMGKGIAYQFKLQFPENNQDYMRSCKNGTLKVGKLHYYKENGKIIINFPTKNKWREKSHIEYIAKGLDALVCLIDTLKINSIAIPPLGSGNGGLFWCDVKELIEGKLSDVLPNTDIVIYEPSRNYKAYPVAEPRLNTSALILMEIKNNLETFSKFRVQKAAYFTDIFLGSKYFSFKQYKYGPYDHSIDIISRNIKEFQRFHGTASTEEAREILYNKIVSEKVNSKLLELSVPIELACSYVNQIRDDYELECQSTICFLVETNGPVFVENIVDGFKQWSEDKAARFSPEYIASEVDKLCENGILEKGLAGYDFSRNLNLYPDTKILRISN